MKYVLAVCLIGSFIHLFGQGLNADIGFNDSYDQKVADVVCQDGYSYVGINMRNQGRCLLKKVDTFGNVLWTRRAEPEIDALDRILSMSETKHGDILVFGSNIMACDLVNQAPFIQKWNAEGEKEWEYIWEERFYFGVSDASKIITLPSGDILFSVLPYDNTSHYFVFSEQGEIKHEGVEDNIELTPFYFNQETTYLGFSDNKLMCAKTDTVWQVIRAFSTAVKDAVHYNDTNYVITRDSIFQFDNAFNILGQAVISNTTELHTIKIIDGQPSVLAASNSSWLISRLSGELSVTNTTLVEPDIDGVDAFDFDASKLAIAKDFELHEFEAIQFQNYSLTGSGNNYTPSTDIGAVDIEPYGITYEPISNSTTHTWMRFSIQVAIKNFGENELNSGRVTIYYGLFGAECPDHYLHEHVFSDVNIASGETEWVDLGEIYFRAHEYGSNVTLSICPYTSHPNGAVDLVVENDAYCEQVLDLTVGIDSHEVENVPKTLLKVVDLYGREIEPKKGQVLLYIYDDGSVEKRVQF